MPVSPERQLRSLLSEAPGELLLTHPVLNIPIYRGSDVELFSGDPSKPYVARIEDFKPGMGLRCRWYWRPFLDFGQSAGMPDIDAATGRSLNSYGASELLGGYREDWNPPEAITALVKVLPIEEWLKLDVTLPAKGIYFTRQVYTEGKGCSPELARTVLAPDPKGATSSMMNTPQVPVLHLQVINPEMRVYECQNCHKLYHPHAVQPGAATREKDYSSQSAISFICGGCGSISVNLPTTPTNSNELQRDTVNEELNDDSGTRSPAVESDRESDSRNNAADSSRNSEKRKKRKSKSSPQSEEKRKQVVDKFYNSLLLGAAEMKAAGLQMKALEMEESSDDTTGDDTIPLNSLARRIEEAMYDNHGQSIKSKSYRAAYRTVSFNLSDPQNASLRRRVLTGEMNPQHLVTASPDELGSDSMKKKRLRQQEKYYKSQVLLEKKLRTSSPDRPVVQAEANRGQEGHLDNDEDGDDNEVLLPPMPEFGLPPSPDKEDLDNIQDDTEMIDHDDAEENSKDLEDLNLSNESIQEAVMMEVEDWNLAQEEMDDISDDALDELGSIEEDPSEDHEDDEKPEDEENEDGKNGSPQLRGSLLANAETRNLVEEALKDRGDWSLEATATRLKGRVEDSPSHLALIDTLRRELCPT
ncbi:SPOC domain containing 1 [Perkinsus chesapeaki]|uniref:SPOC domain containing 1 n=1 Tax=Perkinsus chesapeaki TaxID=330153 RepID=A0A7J6LBE8_PERCH|nr:SPOC domain containing 1 [Perkinsus chesapeaki]